MENLTVTALHDRDGFSKTVIMEEKVINDHVKTWLESNSFEDILKSKGIYRDSQSFGSKNEVVIDTRDGGISYKYNVQNTYGSHDSFFITLVSIPEFEKYDSEICEGADMTVEASLQDIIDATELGNDIDELSAEMLENGKYKISWFDNQNYISAEDFVTKLMHEDWSEWEESHEDYLLEDLEAVSEWEESVKEYYDYVRENNEQGKV